MSARVKMAKGSKAIRRGQSVNQSNAQRGESVHHLNIQSTRHCSAYRQGRTSPYLDILPAHLTTKKCPSPLSRSLTRLLPDPACGTCRKKCRKCDRSRPICNRCKDKGLHCEGYPPRFQFCELATPHDAGGAIVTSAGPAPALPPGEGPDPILADQISAPSVSPVEPCGLRPRSLSSIGAAFNESRPPPPPPLWEADSSASPREFRAIDTPSPASDARLLDDMLLSSETQRLLKYCESVLSLAHLSRQNLNAFPHLILPFSCLVTLVSLSFLANKAGTCLKSTRS